MRSVVLKSAFYEHSNAVATITKNLVEINSDVNRHPLPDHCDPITEPWTHATSLTGGNLTRRSDAVTEKQQNLKSRCGMMLIFKNSSPYFLIFSPIANLAKIFFSLSLSECALCSSPITWNLRKRFSTLLPPDRSDTSNNNWKSNATPNNTLFLKRSRHRRRLLTNNLQHCLYGPGPDNFYATLPELQKYDNAPNLSTHAYIYICISSGY